MRTRLGFVFLLALALVVPRALHAQAKSEGRITGKVVDESGQPVAGATVRATKAGETTPLETSSNDKGEWAFNRVAFGDWTLEIAKDGHQTQRGTVTVTGQANLQKVDVTLPKAAADPNAEIQAELERAQAMLKSSRFPEARKVYEDLLAKYPSVVQLNRFIAATYAGEKNYPKAVEHLRLILEKEPDNMETKLLLADLLMEGGETSEGLEILKSTDMSQAKDPYPYINGAISLIRDDKPEEAVTILTALLEHFPSQAEIYYYRGRAYIAAKKLPEGKADIEKFVATAPPDARELGDAKTILEKLKDIK